MKCEQASAVELAKHAVATAGTKVMTGYASRWHELRTPAGVVSVCPRPEVAGTCSSCAAPPEDRTPTAWAEARVRDAMNRDVVCVHRDISLAKLAELFLARRLTSAPVINERGRAIGLVSAADLAGWRAMGPGHSVSDIMTSLVFWLSENAPLAKAARLMAREGVARAPVVAGDHTVVGLLSTMDAVRWLSQHDGWKLVRR